MDVGLLVSLNVLQRQSQNSPKMSSFMNFVITQRNKITLHVCFKYIICIFTNKILINKTLHYKW